MSYLSRFRAREEASPPPLTMNAALKRKIDQAVERIRHMAQPGNEYEGNLPDAYDAYMAKSAFGPQIRRKIWLILAPYNE